MRVVTQMGIAYLMPKYKYRLLLTAIKNGNSVDLSEYGRCLGQVTNVTDMDAREAAYQLEQLVEKRQRRAKK